MTKRIKIILGVVAVVVAGFIALLVLNREPEPIPHFLNDASRLAALPDTAEILFVSNRDTDSRRSEIYSMDASGQNQQRLTFTNEHHFILGMDRSRRFLVVSRADRDTHKPKGLGDEDRRSVWVIDLETKTEQRLTDPAHNAESRSFSPDGEWIVFMMTLKGEQQCDLYKIKRDGTGLKRLTHTPTALEGDPSWSNDGRRIAFNSLDGLSKNPRFLLQTMDADGGDIRTIYDGGSGVRIGNTWLPGNYDPAWSPDDQWIVFERAVRYNADRPENFGSGVWHIFMVKSDGSGEAIDVSQSAGRADRADYLPSFSRDGNHIVWGSIHQAGDPAQSHNDIFVMDRTDNSLRRLTTHPASDMYPCWIK